MTVKTRTAQPFTEKTWVRETLAYGPWFIVAAAFFVRVYHGLVYRDALPFADGPIGDAQVYHALARAIADGDWLPAGITYRPFLYPYFLGGLYGAFGSAPTPVLIAQGLLGVGTLTLVALIARAAYGRWAALFATLLLAAYGPLVSADTKLLDTALSTFLHVASLGLVLAARGYGLGLSAGLVLGLAALARPPLLLVAGLAILWAWRQRGLRVGVAIGLGLSAPLLVGAGVNFAATGDFSPLSRNGGATFYTGNHGGALGDYAVAPGFSGDPAQQEAEEKALDGSGWSLGLRWLTEHPGDAAVLVARKAYRFALADEAPLEYDYEREREAVPILYALAVPFSLLFVLALCGLGLRWRVPATSLLGATLGAHLVVALVFFVASRYRLPAAPAAGLLAAAAIAELILRAKEGQRRMVALAFSAAALAVVALGFNPLDEPPRRAALASYNEGVAAERAGRTKDAEESLMRALALDPKLGEAWLELGNTFANTGRFDDARRAYRELLARRPGHAVARLNVAITFLRQRKPDPAAAHAELVQVEARAPSGESATQLGNALRGLGRLDEATIAYENAVSRRPNHAGAWNNLGVTLWQRGEARRPMDVGLLERAARALQRAIDCGSRSAASNLRALTRKYARRR